MKIFSVKNIVSPSKSISDKNQVIKTWPFRRIFLYVSFSIHPQSGTYWLGFSTAFIMEQHFYRCKKLFYTYSIMFQFPIQKKLKPMQTFLNNIIFSGLKCPSSQTENDDQQQNSRDKDGEFLLLASSKNIQSLGISLLVSIKWGEHER